VARIKLKAAFSSMRVDQRRVGLRSGSPCKTPNVRRQESGKEDQEESSQEEEDSEEEEEEDNKEEVTTSSGVPRAGVRQFTPLFFSPKLSPIVCSG
jgi:hypothetical protein